ncbi:MAG: hypothetical protein H7Z12_17945 [Rhodospirillaceae bacterium]|nr:hypothetical protein [Rhodospirillales bacterium]
MVKASTSAAVAQRTATHASSEGAGSAAPEEATQPEAVRQAVNVVGVVDVVGALSDGTLANSLYLFDNNQVGGSHGHGTISLTTHIGAADLVVWVCMPLECEAFARIENVEIDARYAPYIALDCGVYPETAVVYWVAKILKPLPGPVPYRLVFRLGSHTEPLVAPVASYLMPAQSPKAVPTDPAVQAPNEPEPTAPEGSAK